MCLSFLVPGIRCVTLSRGARGTKTPFPQDRCVRLSPSSLPWQQGAGRPSPRAAGRRTSRQLEGAEGQHWACFPSWGSSNRYFVPKLSPPVLGAASPSRSGTQPRTWNWPWVPGKMPGGVTGRNELPEPAERCLPPAPTPGCRSAVLHPCLNSFRHTFNPTDLLHGLFRSH